MDNPFLKFLGRWKYANEMMETFKLQFDEMFSEIFERFRR